MESFPIHKAIENQVALVREAEMIRSAEPPGFCVSYPRRSFACEFTGKDVCPYGLQCDTLCLVEVALHPWETARLRPVDSALNLHLVQRRKVKLPMIAFGSRVVATPWLP